MNRQRMVVPLLVIGMLAAAVAAAVPAAADATSGAAADAPSVMVKTLAVSEGQMPRIVTAYGTTAPAPGASITISVQYDGQVADLAVSPGQTVRAGDKLMRVTASAPAMSAYGQAQTALRLAQAELAHATQMRAQQLATRDQVAQAEKAVSDSQTQVDTLRRQGVELSGPPLQAPFDGVVTAVAVGEGDRIQANAPLLTLVRGSGINLVAGVEPGERSAVRVGDAVQMAALSDGGTTITGQVASVGGQIDPKTRLVPVRITRTDGDMLLANQDLRAAITVGNVSGWKLPRLAVLTDDRGTYVFQVADGKAVRVDARVLVDAGDTMLVDAGLRADRKLVTDGAYQLSDGMAVREQDPAP